MAEVSKNTNEKKYNEVKTIASAKGYELKEPLGSGKYADVYKAFAPKNKRLVAIKVIDLLKATPNYRLNFLPQEVKILSECKHKNIIEVFGISQSKNRIMIAMEFAEMADLDNALKKYGPFNETLAEGMFAQILEAIDHMHSKLIAHRDLKLDNILLDKDMIPKLSDFSYAVKFSPGSTPNSTVACGSVPYFAPELFRKKVSYNPLISDIWSLGVCFYLLLNNTFPFGVDNTNDKMIEKQLNKKWKFANKVEPNLSEGLKSVIRRMLEPDVTSRITSEQLIKDQYFARLIKP